MTPLEYALAYAARGWRVHPIPPGHKHPHGMPKWQDNATTDPDRIHTHWAKHPNHGICIVTGHETGIFAIDIDPDHDGDDSLKALEAQYGPLPDTIESCTGGGGRHLLYAWPTGHDIRNAASGVLGVGIDIRGTGGQIVVAPTIHPGTGIAYAWEITHDPLDGIALAQAPEWLIELLTTPQTANEPRQPPRPRLVGDPLPGDWWEAQTDWPTELTRRGWTLHSTHHDAANGYYELWTRPGKTSNEGASASLYYRGSNVLKNFSGNAKPLDADQTYTLWGFEVAHTYDGDYPTAARTVRATMPRPGPTTEHPKPETAGPDMPPARPGIVHNGRQHGDVVDDAIDALHQHNTPPTIFVRSGLIVRLREDENRRPMIENLRTDHLRLALAAAADWYRTNKDGEHTATPPPLDVAASVLVTGHWPYPALAGVVELPVLRPDGTFHTNHGHDDATRLYHWHRGPAYQPIPDTPTPDELAGAVALIDELLADFPWDTAADRANAWALLLTPLVRAIIGQVPMALIDAPEPGTGKGLLVKVCSIITTGHAAALMAWPTDDTELEKKVSATLMAGNTVVVFDNVDGTISSPTLAAVLTADTWQGRILGRSEIVNVPNRATWAATGNNIDVGGDLARRCYRIRIDARQAQPWLRTGWKHDDLEGWTLANRGQLLHALCTIVRSWWAAGQPKAKGLPAMGGYAQWVQAVGGILDHAGIGHFLANLADFHASADQEANAWEAFLTAWSDHLEEEPHTVAQLVVRMTDIYTGSRLRDVLPDDLAGDFDRPQFTKRLGYALRKRVGRHYGAEGLHLIEMPRDRQKVAIYSVTRRSASPDPSKSPAAPPKSPAAERGNAGSKPQDGGGFSTPFPPERGNAGSKPQHSDQSESAGVEKSRGGKTSVTSDGDSQARDSRDFPTTKDEKKSENLSQPWSRSPASPAVTAYDDDELF